MKIFSLIICSLFIPVIIVGQCLDIEPPVIGNPPPIQIMAECDSLPEYDLMASDNSGFYTIAYDEELFSGSCIGTLIRSWTVVDSCGNETGAVQVVNLQDSSPPVIIGSPADTTILCEDALPEIPELTAFDNCTVEPELIFTENIIPAEPFPIILRSWMAEDGCDNQTFWQQQITMIDLEAPQLEFISDTTIIIPFGQNTWELPDLYNWGTIIDNCDEEPSYNQSTSAGTLLALGLHEIDIVSSDDSGNESGTTLIIFIDQSVGVSEIQQDLFKVFPNPVISELNITWADQSITPSYLVLKDITGRQVFDTQISRSNIEVPMAHLPKGVYLLEIYDRLDLLATKKILR